MKKFFTVSLFSLIGTNVFAVSLPWWLQPTVCQLDTTKCYATMGSGFDSELWDTNSKCWGLKLICPDALNESENAPVAMERNQIKKGTGIKPDYDTDLLSADGECFGRRKTDDNGATAMVNGKYVNVYCSGILNNYDEELPNGEIVYDAQPTCSDLASNGYIAALNGNCYGKYYDNAKYYIECGSKLLPERLIVLNGADFTTHGGDIPVTQDDADKKFDLMYSNSQTQKKKYFAE